MLSHRRKGDLYTLKKYTFCCLGITVKFQIETIKYIALGNQDFACVEGNQTLHKSKKEYGLNVQLVLRPITMENV